MAGSHCPPIAIDGESNTYETLHSFPSTLRRATVLFSLGGFLLWAVWYHSVHLLLIAAVGYAVSGPLLCAAAFFRSRSTWSRQ